MPKSIHTAQGMLLAILDKIDIAYGMEMALLTACAAG